MDKRLRQGTGGKGTTNRGIIRSDSTLCVNKKYILQVAGKIGSFALWLNFGLF